MRQAQHARRERPAIRSTLLLALAWIGVAVTSWDAGDGRPWSRAAVLAVGVALCFVYGTAKPRQDGGKRWSMVRIVGTALGLVVVLTWLVLWARRWFL